ncbi:MAG: FtsX-like permease family protein [bacterium]
MLTMKLAFRGLWRHKVRTIITLGAIFMSHCMGLVFLAMNDGGHELMIELGIRQGRAGHVVIQAKGFQKTQSVELLVPDPERVREIVRQRVPRARVVLRAFGGGLVRTADDSVGAIFAGVEPDQERHVSDLAEKVVRGVYLGADEQTVRKAEDREAKRKQGNSLKGDGLWCARPAPKDEPARKQIVIGARMAKTLRVGLCGKVILDVQGMGDRESEQFRVVGIFKTGSVDLDGFFVHLALPEVQRLLHIGKGVHQVAVFVSSVKVAQSTADKLRGPIESGSLEVLAWDKAMPEMAEFIWLDEASGYIFMLILYLIVMIGVLNTVLMSVMERTREFGVMRALGAGPWRIVLLVLMEGALLGLIGVAVGSLLAWPFIHYLENTGIDIGAMSDGAMEAGGVVMTVVKGKLYLSGAIWAGVSVVGMTLAAAIYPALRAAKVQVLKAIHNV